MNVSLDEYQKSLIVNAQGYPFYSLIVAAMRQADTDNLERLRLAFPDVWHSKFVMEIRLALCQNGMDLQHKSIMKGKNGYE